MAPRKYSNTLFLAVCFIHISFLYFFRDERLFPDLDEYVSYFNGLSSTFDNFEAERSGDRFGLGWYLINKFVKILGGDSNMFINAVYLIITYCFIKTIQRYSQFALFSVFIFICTCFYNSIFVLRQWLAMGICLLSIPYIENRKIIPFFLLTILAALTHASAWVWLIVFFIYRFELNKKTLTLFVVSFFVFFATIDIATSYLAQFYGELMAYEVDKEGGTYKVVVMHLSIILLAVYVYQKNAFLSDMNKFFILLLMCALVMDISAMIGSSFGEFSRLSSYYSVAAIFLVPNAMIDIETKYEIKGSLFVFISIAYILLLSSDAQFGFSLKI